MGKRLDDSDPGDTPLLSYENPFRASSAHEDGIAPIIALGTIGTELAGQEDARRTVGGSATHFGLSARYLAPVELIGTVGADFGLDDFAVLAQRGVITSGIRRPDAVTAGARTSHGQELPSAAAEENSLAARTAHGSTRRPSVIYLSGISPAEQLDLVQQNPDTDILAIDVGREWHGASRSDIMTAIRSAEVVFLNSWHARLLTGVSQFVGAARYLQELGAGVVVLRHAEYGASAFVGSHVIKLPAFPLMECIDPTGAGASFAGGFLGAVAWRGSLDWTSLMIAMLCGTVLASFTVERFGVDRILELSREDLADRYDELLAMI
jgi:sugar/nucleoside kinase (ribokinase family)